MQISAYTESYVTYLSNSLGYVTSRRNLTAQLWLVNVKRIFCKRKDKHTYNYIRIDGTPQSRRVQPETAVIAQRLIILSSNICGHTTRLIDNFQIKHFAGGILHFSTCQINSRCYNIHFFIFLFFYFQNFNMVCQNPLACKCTLSTPVPCTSIILFVWPGISLVQGENPSLQPPQIWKGNACKLLSCRPQRQQIRIVLDVFI